MKKIFKLVLFSSLIIVSCNKLTPEMVDAPSSYKQIIIDAGFQENGVKTMISSDDPKVVMWCPRDSFTLFYQGNSSVFRSDSLYPTKKSKFKGCIDVVAAEIDSLSYDNRFYAIHPHREGNKFVKDGLLRFDVDSVQTAVPGSFDPESFPSIAQSSSTSLAFYNVCGGVAFTLKNKGIRKIVFSTRGKQHIAGRINVRFDAEGKPAVESFQTYADSIVLYAPGDSVFSTGVRYYISMVPVELSEGFSVTFHKQTTRAVYSHTVPQKVNRSIFGVKENIDEDIQFVVKVSEVSLDKHEINLDQGDSVRLHAVVLPEDVSDRSVIWSSSDNDIATVDDNGMVRSVASGEVTITAASKVSPDVKDNCLIVFDKVVNLCKNGTANCYITPEPGKYKIKADARGVSGQSLGNIASAVRLWQFKNVEYNMIYNPVSIISDVQLSKDKKWVTFIVPESIEEGSAVIAVKDSEGNVLWSWHIWVAEGYDPEKTAQVYANGAGTVMSRNLGSCSDSGPNYQNPGMYYQWGRKDPFPGYYGIPIKYVTGNDKWPEPVLSTKTTGTIAYTIANPMTYLTSNGGSCFNYDWYYIEEGKISLDITRWGEIKTDYDPCPFGWKVPKGGSDGLWATASGTSKMITETGIWSYDNKGMYLEDVFGTTDKCWYGATGNFIYSDGTLTSGRIIGYYWSYTYDTDRGMASCFHIDRSDQIYPVYYGYGSTAMALRCVKDTAVQGPAE